MCSFTAVAFVSVVIVNFSSVNSICKHSAFFCSLLGLVAYSFEKATALKKLARNGIALKIIHLRSSWLVLRNDGLQTGFSCL